MHPQRGSTDRIRATLTALGVELHREIRQTSTSKLFGAGDTPLKFEFVYFQNYLLQLVDYSFIAFCGNHISNLKDYVLILAAARSPEGGGIYMLHLLPRLPWVGPLLQMN